MKVTIRGNNPITSQQVKNVIDNLNDKYGKHGVKVKNMTCYIRFVDEDGKTVEPLVDGEEVELVYEFKSTKCINENDEDCKDET